MTCIKISIQLLFKTNYEIFGKLYVDFSIGTQKSIKRPILILTKTLNKKKTLGFKENLKYFLMITGPIIQQY